LKAGPGCHPDHDAREPDHPQAARQDYESFYRSNRPAQLQFAPPFAELYTVTATGLDESSRAALQRLRAGELKKLLSGLPETGCWARRRCRWSACGTATAIM
jgi:hypothetical protein